MITQTDQSARETLAHTIRTAHKSRLATFRHTDLPRPFYGLPIDNPMILWAWQHRVKPRFAGRQSDIAKCYEML